MGSLQIMGKIDSLKNLFSLKDINVIELQSIDFGESNFKEFAIGLQYLKSTLKKLYISYCFLGENSIKILAESIKEFTKLRDFLFYHMDFNENHLKCLFEGLQSSCDSLEIVFISLRYYKLK